MPCDYSVPLASAIDEVAPQRRVRPTAGVSRTESAHCPPAHRTPAVSPTGFMRASYPPMLRAHCLVLCAALPDAVMHLRKRKQVTQLRLARFVLGGADQAFWVFSECLQLTRLTCADADGVYLKSSFEWWISAFVGSLAIPRTTRCRRAHSSESYTTFLSFLLF